MNSVESVRWPCRVCGYDLEFDVWGGDDNSNCTHDICDCCGAEAGLDDFNLEVVRRYRQEWIAGGHKWFSPEEKPKNWDIEKQLAQIPERWR